jgi:hypothetical protein
MTPLGDPKKEEAIPASAGHFAGDGAQRAIPLRLIFKAVFQNLDYDPAVFKLAGEQGARRRKPPVSSRSRAIQWSYGVPRSGFQSKVRWSPDSKIRIVSDLERPPACALTEISFDPGLQTPGDTTK